MPYRELQYVVEDPVAVITLDRPDALNAFTTRMLAELRHALAAAEADPAVVGTVITGAGRGFCAGMDMQALDNLADGDGAADDLSALAAQPGDPAMGDDFTGGFTWILAIGKPVIAAVNGPCAGLGLAIACLADLRFVARTAKFATAFSQRGLIAEHATSWLLPRIVGPSRALDLLWSARKVDGEEAMQLGLADRLCDDGDACVAAARAYIEHLAATASPTSLKVMKQQVWRHLNTTLGPAMDESNRLMAESLTRADFREGVSSFLEKRPPAFRRLGD